MSGDDKRRIQDPWWLQALLISVTVGFVALFLALPVAVIFSEALKDGWKTYVTALKDPAAWSAIQLTCLVTVISVPLNTLFGLAASWAIAKFEFKGKSLLLTLIDIPFAVSPVISGFIYVLLFGLQGWFGQTLSEWGFKVIFAVPGIVLVTMFVTFPFVARELIPLMQEQGNDEEQAAISLGAKGWQTFLYVTLPNIRWGLLYGVILCNARAMGEFGAVSVVSGSIRGKTATLPLHVEVLYNGFNVPAAFAMASLLAVVGLLTLALKTYLEWKVKQQRLELAVAAD
jgi:sulfate transport system permease protein